MLFKKFSVDSPVNPIMANESLMLGIEDYIRISTLMKKKVKPEGSAVSNHLTVLAC